MEALASWFRRRLWAAFLAHQAGLFAISIVFLSSVKRITGRTIHLGRDPIGLGDGAAMIVLSVTVILLTRAFYSFIKGAKATPLGIALSPRRFADLVIGYLVGFAFIIAPWVIALLQGEALIEDRINAHFDNFSTMRILTVALLVLLLQSAMEETANRAFPMRLWEESSLAFRLVVPSVFFIAIHLVNEQFSFERVGVLFMAALLQGIAYALTGNIWLSSGVHLGANFANYSISGLWHAGAVVALIGRPIAPNWVAAMIMLAGFSATFALLRRRKAKSTLVLNAAA
jgi:membrane protease YdiL (CAAX protease family)